MADYRIFVEKKPEFRVEAESLRGELNENLQLNLKTLRLLNVYDLFGFTPELQFLVPARNRNQPPGYPVRVQALSSRQHRPFREKVHCRGISSGPVRPEGGFRR